MIGKRQNMMHSIVTSIYDKCSGNQTGNNLQGRKKSSKGDQNHKFLYYKYFLNILIEKNNT